MPADNELSAILNRRQNLNDALDGGEEVDVLPTLPLVGLTHGLELGVGDDVIGLDGDFQRVRLVQLQVDVPLLNVDAGLVADARHVNVDVTLKSTSKVRKTGEKYVKST